MKRILALVLALMMVLSLVACGETGTPATTTEPPVSTTPSDVTVKGEGATSFYFNVTDLDGIETKFQVKTDAATVGEALLAVELIAGDESDWGLYVTSVNGITADWDTEKAYWAFYINGEYAQTGVDATEITAGATYSFVKTSSATTLGEGATKINVTVKDLDGTETYFIVNTDAATVGEALLAVELIAGDPSDWGLYVTSVNGITADWDSEKAYWSFYIDGEYAQTGVDATEITAGSTYTFEKVSSATTLGEGATKINVTVKDVDGTETYFIVNTDAATVGEALLAVELIAGDPSDYGLYVTSVNGITADWDTEKAYWAFYINGEYAQTGVDSTEITSGATYTFEKTISEE